jgi:hypothetical protein
MKKTSVAKPSCSNSERAEILFGRFLMKKLMAIFSSLVALVLAAGAGISWL